MLTPRQFETLGRETFKRNPELAREIIKDSNLYPDLFDLSLIPEIYKKFSELKKSKPLISPGRVYKHEERTIFCALIIRLFDSEYLNNKKSRVKHGLSGAIERILIAEFEKGRATHYTKNARFFYNTYKDFKAELERIYLIIIKDYVA